MNYIDKLKEYVPSCLQEEKDKEVMLKYLNDFDNVYTRENEYGHFTASSWIVNKNHTKVLMIYHNIYKSWSWTGGHNDGCEDFLEVAVKEAKEETGLEDIKVCSSDIYSLEILSVSGHMKRGKYVSSHVHLNLTFLLEADEDSYIRIKEDENSGVRWINIDEINNYVTEDEMKVIYEKLNNKLLNF